MTCRFRDGAVDSVFLFALCIASTFRPNQPLTTVPTSLHPHPFFLLQSTCHGSLFMRYNDTCSTTDQRPARHAMHAGTYLQFPSSRIVLFKIALRDDRRSCTATFNRSNMATVVCQSTHASVIETPYFRQEGPSAGTSCLPSLMWDSIITPVIFISPERSCMQISSRTSGWLL